jgi:hypothetical protein
MTGYSCANLVCEQRGDTCCKDYGDCGARAFCGLDNVLDMKGCDTDCKPIFECVALTGCVKENEETGLNSGRDCCEGLAKETVYRESPPCGIAEECLPSPADHYICVRI